MSWMSEHVAEVSAIGSIGMNVATLVIIFFNLNQLRLNRRTLNIEVNFKVFELRKKIYRSIEDFIKVIKEKKEFSSFIDDEVDPPVPNKKFLAFKESIEDCKYLFSLNLTSEIESLLFLCECGIKTECEMQRIKDGDPSNWTAEVTRQIQELANKKQDIIESIALFELEHFLEYLNVSNFHKDFIGSTDKAVSRRFLRLFKKLLKRSWKTMLAKKAYPEAIKSSAS